MAEQTKSTPVTLDNFTTALNGILNRVQTDPEFAAERAAAAASDWEKNVLRPRRDPLKAAIAAGPKRAEKVRQSLDEKKWEKAMANVDEDLMYATIRKRGAAAFRSGVEDRKEKVIARVKELQPLVTGLKKTIEAMPDVTDADREARLLAARRGMIEIGKRRRGL